MDKFHIASVYGCEDFTSQQGQSTLVVDTNYNEFLAMKSSSTSSVVHAITLANRTKTVAKGIDASSPALMFGQSIGIYLHQGTLTSKDKTLPKAFHPMHQIEEVYNNV